MSARLPLSRAWIVTALLCVLLVTPLVSQRVIASAGGPGIAVIGDSITARYDDNAGSAQQAWWSVVGRHYGEHVTTFAQTGSGYVRTGDRCLGTRFGDRLADVAKSSPRVVIVEGGRNDWAYCAGDLFSVASNARVRASVDDFLTQLQRAVGPATTIFVLGPPWGPVDASQRTRITSIIKASAQRHHIQFIDTRGVFDGGRTIDGTHPNRAGNMALGRRVIAGIGPNFPDHP